jgi:hypothetical protein
MRACATSALSLLLLLTAEAAAPPADFPPDPPEDTRAPVPATRALATEVPDIRWPERLDDVVYCLQVWCDVNGFATNIFVDPAGLRDAGVEPDALVTIDADGEDTIQDVLTQALAQAGQDTRTAELSFATTGRFVLISTAGRAKGLAADLRADAGRGTTKADRAALARPMTHVWLRFPTLEDVMDMAAKASGLAVEPDWEQLATAGLKPDDMVTVRLRAVTVAQFLRVALQDAAPTEPLAFVATDGRIRVSSRTALSAEIRELDAATKARAKAKATTQPVAAKRPRRASSPAAPPG